METAPAALPKQTRLQRTVVAYLEHGGSYAPGTEAKNNRKGFPKAVLLHLYHLARLPPGEIFAAGI